MAARSKLSSLFLSVAPAVYFFDTFYSIKRVQDDSMEKSLCEGDIVLIRKADFLPHYFKKKLTLNDLEEHESDSLDEDNDVRKSIRMDAVSGKPPADALSLWRSPPMVLPGDVIAFTNPQDMNNLQLKRVTGIGGQRIRPRRMIHKIEHIRPYDLWVESDNGQIAYNGSVSKKLMKGKVDRILWPPSKMGKVPRVRPPRGRHWWP